MTPESIRERDLRKICRKLNEELIGSHDFVPTIGGRGECHPHGLVGNLWRIRNPESVSVGDCFLKGRLKKKDLFLCICHSGDCFQTYIYIEEYDNCLIGKPQWSFGSYGIGDADKIEISKEEFSKLKNGGRIEKRDDDSSGTIVNKRWYIGD